MTNRTRRALAATVASVVVLGSARAFAIQAFPGAEGFAGTFPSATFGTASVYHVTTTADTLDGNSKPVQGTLRGAFYDYTNPASPKQQASNRIVIFDVGGTFTLTNGSLDMKTISNIYVAGQTAPSPVTVYGDTSQFTHSNNTVNNNVILRYMSFRRGTAVAGNTDSLTFAGGSSDGTGSAGTNLIVDHASTSWSTDEDLSVANVNTNITVQYSIVSDSLRSTHAYGTLIRPRSNSNVSYLHDLYSNNLSRNPRPGTYNGNTLNFDFENNVVYNWANRAGYTGGASEPEIEHVNMNYVGNYAVAGPSTPAGTTASTAFTLDTSGDVIDLHVYQTGNAIDSDKTANPGGVPNGSNTDWGMFAQSNGVSTSAFPAASKWTFPIGNAGNTGAPANTVAAPTFVTQSAADAYSQVINYVGNYWWARDAIDARVIDNVKNNTNPPQGVAATDPNAAELAALLATPVVSRPAGFDSDGDGMPNAWETAMGLNPNSAADGKLDFDNDGYTNVEEYLNEQGAFPAPFPIVFNGATSTRYAVSGNWDANPDPTAVSNWQPSRFDTVQINVGTAFVDAIDQDAGTVLIGATTANAPTLVITSGWLHVRKDIVVGQSAGATNSLLLVSGGKLIVDGTIMGGAGSDNLLGFNNGTLVVNTINTTALRFTSGPVGQFVQSGPSSVFAPGDTGIAGRTNIIGNYGLQTGHVAIELGGSSPATSFQSATPSFDNLLVTGAVALASGALDLSLLNGYSPANLVAHPVISAASVSGHFQTVSGLVLAPNKYLAVTYTPTSVFVTATTPGDIDVDGDVDFNDLLKMAQSYGSTGNTWSTGDLTGNGVTNFDDLLLLAQFYSTGPAGTLTGSFAGDWELAQTLAPEPTALTALTIGGLALLRRSKH